MGRSLPTSRESSQFLVAPHSCHSLPFFPPRSDPDLQINQTPNIPSSHHYRSFFDPPKPTTVPECIENTARKTILDRTGFPDIRPPRNKQKRRSRSRWFEKPQIQTGVFFFPSLPPFRASPNQKYEAKQGETPFLCDQVGVSLLTFLTHVFPTGCGIKMWKGRTLGSSNADNYHSNHNLVPVDDQAYGGAGELFPSKSSIPRQFPHRASLAVDGEGIECRFIETRPVIIPGRHSPPYDDPACQQFRTVFV